MVNFVKEPTERIYTNVLFEDEDSLNKNEKKDFYFYGQKDYKIDLQVRFKDTRLRQTANFVTLSLNNISVLPLYKI